jgi:hypothetical protein
MRRNLASQRSDGAVGPRRPSSVGLEREADELAAIFATIIIIMNIMNVEKPIPTGHCQL